VFFRLYQCTNMLHKTGTKALEAYTITTQQWAVLGLSPARRSAAGWRWAIWPRSCWSAGRTWRACCKGWKAWPISRGWWTRKTADRLILLTDKGRSLWDADMRPVIADYYREALAGFSAEDKIQLGHYLDRMLHNFKAIAPDPVKGTAKNR
jgi:hypothetical protein